MQDVETVSTSSQTLQDETSVDEFFNVAATETLALFEHLEFEFLYGFDVFAPSKRGRTREHHPPELFRAFLHCYYNDIYGIRPVARELQNTLVWLSCGFDSPPSRDTVDRFLTDLEHVVDEVFGRLVEQAAARGLLDTTYRIDSTDVRAMPSGPDASKCYDSTADEYYYGYGCTIVSTGSKIPIAAEKHRRPERHLTLPICRMAMGSDRSMKTNLSKQLRMRGGITFLPPPPDWVVSAAESDGIHLGAGFEAKQKKYYGDNYVYLAVSSVHGSQLHVFSQKKSEYYETTPQEGTCPNCQKYVKRYGSDDYLTCHRCGWQYKPLSERLSNLLNRD